MLTKRPLSDPRVAIGRGSIERPFLADSRRLALKMPEGGSELNRALGRGVIRGQTQSESRPLTRQLTHPLRQFRPPSSLDLPFDGHPDGLLLADQHDQLPAPGDAGIEEVPS